MLRSSESRAQRAGWRSARSRCSRWRPAAFGQAAKKAAPPAAKASASTLERVKSSGSLKLGYRTDARPFSFQDASGKPGGILGGPVPGHR